MSFLRRASETRAATNIFPTFLQPSLPFRRKSRASSTDSAVSTASNTSALSTSTASTASSNPFSRCPTPSPIPVEDTDVLPPTDKFLSGHKSHIQCVKCSTDLCLTTQIISKGFTGRHGRAFLVQGGPIGQGLHVNASVLPNTYLNKAVPRNLVTGQHTVSDISCAICDSLLGWKYVGASEEGQKYKVGKFILETKKIKIGVTWEDDEAINGAMNDYDYIVPLSTTDIGRIPDVTAVNKNPLDFDSQDEDECEDLFAGVWSPQLAARRRQRKHERISRKAVDVARPVNQSQDSLA